MAEPLLELSRVTTSFRLGRGAFRPPLELKAVDEVSLRLFRGETLGLVGESGSGKSTLGRTALRLLEADSGFIGFDGVDLRTLGPGALRGLRARMQPVFQDSSSALNPRMCVGELLQEPLRIHGRLTAGQRLRRARELLGLTGLPEELWARLPGELSGGQRQRIGIARALASGPDLVVADEPVSALDVSVQAQVLNLLVDLQKDSGLTYLFISHDLQVVAYLSTRVAVMYLGRIVELGPTEAVLASPRHPYTQALAAASRRSAFAELPAPGPAPTAADPGCRFAARCPHASERCRRERPATVQVSEDHGVACFLWGG